MILEYMVVYFITEANEALWNTEYQSQHHLAGHNILSSFRNFRRPPTLRISEDYGPMLSIGSMKTTALSLQMLVRLGAKPIGVLSSEEVLPCVPTSPLCPN